MHLLQVCTVKDLFQVCTLEARSNAERRCNSTRPSLPFLLDDIQDRTTLTAVVIEEGGRSDIGIDRALRSGCSYLIVLKLVILSVGIGDAGECWRAHVLVQNAVETYRKSSGNSSSVVKKSSSLPSQQCPRSEIQFLN
jgi:hypothetical protein